MDEAVADISAVEEEGAIPTDRIIAEVTAAGEAPVVEVIGASAGVQLQKFQLWIQQLDRVQELSQRKQRPIMP